MLSYQFREYGAALEPIEAPTPTPEGDEVLIEVEACGVCHSDLHIHHGRFHLGGNAELDVRANRMLPFTLGHEIAGVVVAAGSDTSARIGASVVVYPWIGCGSCTVCARGQEQLCVQPAHLGINVNGGYATHVLVPHDRYLVDRLDIPAPTAGPLACSTLTAFSALGKAPEGPTLIIGAGGVGLAALAQISGTRPIAVAEVREEARAAALRQQADLAIDPTSEAGLAELRAFFNDEGRPRAVLDFVGTHSSIELGFRSLDRGGSIVLVGLFGGELRRPLPYFPMLGHGLIGSNTGSLVEFREVVAQVLDSTLTAAPVETRQLSTADETLRDLSDGAITGRVVLNPG